MVLGVVCTLFMITGSPVKGVLMMALGFLAGGGRHRRGQRARALHLRLDQPLRRHRAPGRGHRPVRPDRGAEQRRDASSRARVLAERIRNLWPTLADWRASWRPMLRGSGLGFLLGLVPGGGPVTASFMSYALEKRISAHPERFGKGAIEGVAGPESANNAAVAGSIIPVLSLGIPGNPVTALLLGALVIQGIQPGPLFIDPAARSVLGHRRQHVCGQRVPAAAQPAAGRACGRSSCAFPTACCFRSCCCSRVVGTYSANKNVFDLWVMLGFGIAGLCAAQAGIRPRALRHRLRARAAARAVAAAVVGDVARRRYDLRPTSGDGADACGQRRSRRSDVPSQTKNLTGGSS